MMLTGIKNIVFDLGGVLVDLDGKRCIDAFDAIGCHAISDYVRLHRTEDLFYDIEIGHTTTAEFCREVRSITHTSATDTEIVGAWNALLTTIADEKKQRLLSLRRDYRVFLLSNTNDMHWRLCADHLFNYGPWRADDMFERIYLSYRLHLAKPDPAIGGRHHDRPQGQHTTHRLRCEQAVAQLRRPVVGYIVGDGIHAGLRTV